MKPEGDELKSMELRNQLFRSSAENLTADELRLPREKMDWWEDAKFGLFIHWGLYAIPARGEWVMFNEKIPAEEYAKLADEFNPQHFDAEEWARIADEAGMKYMVLTARHHDGFALWDSPSSYGDFTSAKTAAQRDFVAEYVEACRGAGLGVGLYYSPMDWRFPGYFRPRELRDNAELMKIQGYGQVEELMRDYGDIDILWYDGGWLAHKGSDADAAWFWEPEKLNAMVRSLQPDVMISPRSGWVGDFQIHEGASGVKGPIIETPWEKCMNLNNTSWGFNTTQRPFKAQDVVRYLVDVAGRGGNLLLNVGPDRDGVIPPSHVSILREVGSWLSEYGESIYGTRAGPFQPEDNLFISTHRGNKIYLHVLPTAEQTVAFTFPPLDRHILSYEVLNGGSVGLEQNGSGIEVKLSGRPDDGYPSVVLLTLDDPL